MEENEKRLLLIQTFKSLVDAFEMFCPFKWVPREFENPILEEQRKFVIQKWLSIYEDLKNGIRELGYEYEKLFEELVSNKLSEELSKARKLLSRQLHSRLLRKGSTLSSHSI